MSCPGGSTNSKDDFVIPRANTEGSRYLYCLEVGLREYTIRTLHETVGPLWWKSRLPSDILDKVRDARRSLSGTAWARFAWHHPLHYVDFPDLKKILLRRDNWDQAFSDKFIRKEILEGMLANLEPVRNSIAHNREISAEDVEALRIALQQVSSAIGVALFADLIKACTHIGAMPERLAKLVAEISVYSRLVPSLKEVDEPIIWRNITNEWWFDEDYLNADLDVLHEFFRLVAEYRALPRLRGTGHVIEAWVSSSGFVEHGVKALNEVEALQEGN